MRSFDARSAPGRWLRQGLAAMALLTCAPSVGAAAQTINWDMATTAVQDSVVGQATQAFVANFAARVEGQMGIVASSPNTLMKPPEIKDAVRRGVVPVGEFTLSVHGGEAPIYGLDSVPFLATSYEAARRLYEIQKPYLEKRLAEEGLKLLYSAPYLPQGLCTQRPLASAADMRGLRLRSYNHVTKKLAVLSGAVPVSVDTSDIPSAMTLHRIDAFTASAGQFVSRNVWTFAPQFHDLSIWIPRNAVVANKAQFDALAPEVQKAMLDAAKFAEKRAWAAAEQEHAARVRSIPALGGQVVASQALLDSFGPVGRQIAGEWSKAAGPDGEAILQAYRR
ncbi:MAG: TRAP transporter substrate-binding protein DctP [Rhizobiales bacterium]|nr:TRAP transporter substrate-binding protein DctP [Hyphomicrobiales bacterium]